jgi:hypothetical protein
MGSTTRQAPFYRRAPASTGRDDELHRSLLHRPEAPRGPSRPGDSRRGQAHGTSCRQGIDDRGPYHHRHQRRRHRTVVHTVSYALSRPSAWLEPVRRAQGDPGIVRPGAHRLVDRALPPEAEAEPLRDPAPLMSKTTESSRLTPAEQSSPNDSCPRTCSGRIGVENEGAHGGRRGGTPT